jgi:hypothetical protein
MFFTNQTFAPNSPATAYNVPCNHSMTIPLTLTLVWTDPPGHTDGHKQLVNDLDLVVIVPGTSSQIFGNMRAHADSTNTVERVVTQCPPAGFVTAIVGWDTLRTSSQDWYLVANGPVSSELSPTALPLYTHGRWTTAVTQSESCIGESLAVSVWFNPTSVWSCAGQPSNVGLPESEGSLDCSVLSQEFRLSLAHILGVSVEGIYTAVNAAAITITLSCSAMINSMDSGLSLKYVTPTAQLVAIQNVIAMPHSMLLNHPFNPFNWTTLELYVPPPPPSQEPPPEWFAQPNALQLSFATSHLCSSRPVTRSCLLRNSSFPSGQFHDSCACTQAHARTFTPAFCVCNFIYSFPQT